MSKYQAWKSFEAEVVKFFEGIGFNAKRNWASQFTQKDGVDVVAEKDGKRFAVQCKYSKVEMPKIMKAWDEILDGKEYKDIPVVVVRGRHREATQSVVLLSWSDFKKLITVSGGKV